jgi:hypothetical protein
MPQTFERFLGREGMSPEDPAPVVDGDGMQAPEAHVHTHPHP